MEQQSVDFPIAPAPILNSSAKLGRVVSGRRSKSHRLQPPRCGDICPNCHIERLDYDGLLNLACPGCGFSLSQFGSCS